MWVGLLVDTKR